MRLGDLLNVTGLLEQTFFLVRVPCDLSASGIVMSSIETVKIIVDAEKAASTMLNEAQNKASEVLKQVDALIDAERQNRLSLARKEAASILQRAEAEAKSEAVRYGEESKQRIKLELEKASANKAAAIKSLFEIIMG